MSPRKLHRLPVLTLWSVFALCAVEGAFASSYSTWVSQQGLSGPAALAATVVAHDGLQNQMKYSLGLTAATNYNPGDPALPQVQTTIVSGATYLTLSFNGVATDVIYVVQATGDLSGTWTTIYTSTSGVAPGVTTVQDTQSMSGSSQRYLRLQVTLVATPVDTAGLWVDQNAAAGGDGSYARPFQTVAAAIAQSAKTTDTNTRITLRAGTYREPVRIDGQYSKAKSGTATTPFVVRGMPGERVILSGMKQIAGWSLYSGGIYVANLGTWNPATPAPPNKYPDTFYVGMNERLMAQSPNVGTAPWTWQSTAPDGNGNTIITDTAHLTGIGSLVGGYAQLYCFPVQIGGATILSNDPVAGTVTIQGTFTGTNGSYIVKGCLQLLDAPGEWCCVAQGDGTYKMYYWPVNAGEQAAMLTTNPPTQSRDGYGWEVLMNGLSYVNVQGLEIMGASGNVGAGVSFQNCSNCSVTNCVIHDNGGYLWSGTKVSAITGDGIFMRTDTNCTVSNNVITLNWNGMAVTSCTNTVITQNDIGYNYIDGIDLSSANNLKTPCVNTTFSYNYDHHNFNMLEHPDAIQTYESGVQGLNVVNNVILSEVQIMINGLGSGNFQGNVIWNANINNLAGKDTLGYVTGPITVANNTIEDWFSLGSAIPASATGNVIYGRLTIHSANYTGDRNLVQSMAFSSSTYDTADFISISPTNVWSAFGYQNTGVAGFYKLTGQDQNSQIASPSQAQFINLPTTLRVVDYANHMANFSTNADSTTVPLVETSTTGSQSHPLGDFAVGDYIEFDLDGVLRQITAITPANNTVTFKPALYSNTVGDGLGWATLPRTDIIERWGTRTNFARDCRLAPGTPGLTMSSSGGPIGCQLSIANFQIDDFNGDGMADVPALPADMRVNQLAHSWHLSPWFSYGN